MRALKIIGPVIVAIAAFWAVVQFLHGLGKNFTPTTDTFTFERDVRADKDAQLDVEQLVSKEGSVPLHEILNEKGLGRYGADTIAPDGVGLDVTFRIKRGTTVIRESKFEIPEWKHFEETGNTVRRKLVANKAPELMQIAVGFANPVDMSYTFAVVVDTTEGVGDKLIAHIADTINDAIGGQYGKSDVRLYTLYEMAYQGGRTKVKPTSSDDLKVKLTEFLAGDSNPRLNSSVVKGLASVLADVKQSLKDDETIQVHVWTDGLENTEAISVYKDPTLLAESNWPKLDSGWNPETLKFSGLEIHIHPLPPKSHREEDRMAKGLEYITRRLSLTGATVVLETI